VNPPTFIPKALGMFCKGCTSIMMGVTQGMMYTRTKGKVDKAQLHNECAPPPKVDHGCDVEMKLT
jgi:hypothetical protein